MLKNTIFVVGGFWPAEVAAMRTARRFASAGNELEKDVIGEEKPSARSKARSC
jgi:hypothetical protein